MGDVLRGKGREERGRDGGKWEEMREKENKASGPCGDHRCRLSVLVNRERRGDKGSGTRILIAEPKGSSVRVYVCTYNTACTPQPR